MDIIAAIGTFFLFLVFWLYLFRDRKEILIVIFPLFIQGYTGFIPGLFWMDIVSLLWLVLSIIYVKRIGTFSLCFILAGCFQVLSNTLSIMQDNFISISSYDYIITPLHFYFPIVMTYLMIENLKIDLHFFREKYLWVLWGCFLAIMFARITVPDEELFRSTVPIISSIAGAISVISPIIFLYSEKKAFSYQFILLFSTLIVLLASETRGAMVNFIILVILVWLSKMDMKKFIFCIMGVCLAVEGFVHFVEYLPLGVQSIVTLYTSLFSGNGVGNIDGELIKSGDRTRFLLWNFALSEWMDNPLFGTGTNQFLRHEAIDGLPVDKIISPHHAFLSYAVSGGIMTVLFHFLPMLLFIKWNMKKRLKESKFMIYAGIVYLCSSLLLGYSYSFPLFLIFYFNRKYLTGELKMK